MFTISLTYVSRIDECSKITNDSITNTVIVRLPEKHWFKSVSVIIILTLLQRPFLTKIKACSKTILL